MSTFGVGSAGNLFGALTRDGHVIGIRPVSPGDAPGLTACHQHADERSLRYRFFTFGVDSVEREVKRLTRPASEDFAALVALDHERIIGVASYERAAHDRERAAVAVFVDPRHHGRGIATLLLEHLSAVARAHGVTRLAGNVRSDNLAMLKVACGLSVDGVAPALGSAVEVELPTSWSDRERDDHGERERVAEAASLSALMRPNVVAVVGTGLPGHGPEILRAINSRGFHGQLYAVATHGGRMAGLDCHPSLTALPQPVDLAVIAMPAVALGRSVDEAITAGVRTAILTADIDSAAARDLVERARRHDLRLLGPGSLGVITTGSDLNLTACATTATVEPGTVALVSRSASVGTAMLWQAAHRGLGVRAFVSLGDARDVDERAVLSYCHDDPDCDVIALCPRSSADLRGIARLARNVSRRKPIIALTTASGESRSTDPALAVSLAHTGVIGVGTVGELLDTAAMLTGQPSATGDRVAILGNANGLNTLALATAHRSGLSVPTLSPGSRERLGADATTTAGTVDLVAGVSPEAFGAAIATLANSGEVDVMAVIVDVSASGDVPWYLRIIAEAADATALPVAVVLTGLREPPRRLGKRGLAVFGLPEPALAALGRAVAYSRWRRRSDEAGCHPTGLDRTASRTLLDDARQPQRRMDSG